MNGLVSSWAEVTTPVVAMSPAGRCVTLSHWAIEACVAASRRTIVHTTWLSPRRFGPANTSIVMTCWSPRLGPVLPRSTCSTATTLPVSLKSPPLPCLSAWAEVAARPRTGTAIRERSFLFMPPMVRCAGHGAIRGYPQGLPQSARELGARGDVELAVGARQVHLDRLLSQEQCLRDLAVGHAVGGHPRDALLGRGQLAPALDRIAARARPGGDELIVRSRRDRRRAARGRELDGLGQRRAGRGGPARAPVRGAEREQGERELQPRRRRAQDRDRLVEVFDARACQSGRAQRHPERPRLAEGARPRDVLGGELAGLIGPAELRQQGHRVRPP